MRSRLSNLQQHDTVMFCCTEHVLVDCKPGLYQRHTQLSALKAPYSVVHSVQFDTVFLCNLQSAVAACNRPLAEQHILATSCTDSAGLVPPAVNKTVAASVT